MSEIPEFLIELLTKQYGEELTKKILEGYSKKRRVTFRVNTIKSNREEIESVLNEKNIKYFHPDWFQDAFILEEGIEEKVLEELDIYNDGKIYMQSLSSMIPPLVLKPEQGKDILDMAAAPGGKTTEMAALTNNKAHITACELNAIRIEKLKYNIEKQSAKSIYVMNKDARQIDDFMKFDQILLDAPCSGSGTITVYSESLNKYFTTKLIEKSEKSQLALLKKAIKILKQGGSLVYSTCSILSTENEQNVEKLLMENNIGMERIDTKLFESVPKLPTSLPGSLCVMPTELYEGFYVIKLIKR